MKTKRQLWHEAREVAGQAIETLLARNMHDHAAKVAGLVFEWNTRLTTTAGKAKLATNTVELSWPVFREEENLHGFRNTVLHEIAHHLAPGGHHCQWRAVFVGLGGDGKRCHSFKVQKRKTSTVELACTGCSRPLRLGPTRMRRIRAGAIYSCGRCHTPIRLDAPRKLQQRG